MGVITIYDYSVTGDCSNVGAGEVTFKVTGDSPTWYVVQTPTPNNPLPTSGLTGSDTYYFSGLTGG